MTSSVFSIGTLIVVFFITSSNSFMNFYDFAYAQQANLKDPDILFLTINGLILGLGVIVGITFGTRKLTKRLPIRILFGLTLGLGAYVSIALIGNAIRIFQEVGYISTTPTFAILPQLDINFNNHWNPPHSGDNNWTTNFVIHLHNRFNICAKTTAQKKESHRKFEKVNGRF